MRVQVKYRSAKLGAVHVRFRSVWADRKGSHAVPMDKTTIDVVCIYCPETDECYYVRPTDHADSVTLRIVPSRNGQRVGVVMATAYRSLRAEPRTTSGMRPSE